MPHLHPHENHQPTNIMTKASPLRLFIRIISIVLAMISIVQPLPLYSQQMDPEITKMPAPLSKETEKINFDDYIKELEEHHGFSADGSPGFHFKGFVFTASDFVSCTHEEKEKYRKKDSTFYHCGFSGFNMIKEYPTHQIYKFRYSHTLRFYVVRTDHDSCVDVVKEFNSKGFLRSKYLSPPRCIQRVGIGYEYDDTGKLLREVDYDKGYEFKFVDVIAYYNEKGMFSDWQKPNFEQVDHDGKKAWQINYFEGADYVTDILDGKSGKVFHTFRESR